MDFALDQRGRASIDFLVSFGRASGQAETLPQRDFAAAGSTEEALADALDERLIQVETALANSRTLRTRDIFFEWSSTVRTIKKSSASYWVTVGEEPA